MPAPFTRDEVFPIIFESLSTQLGSDTPLSPETALRDDLGMDSLEIVELGVALERKLSLIIPDAQLRACVTLEDVTRLVLAVEQDKDREVPV